jgi:aquaporin related protein
MSKHVSLQPVAAIPSRSDSWLTITPSQHSHAPLRERFPILGRILPEWAYHALISFIGEFLGTTFFLFFALAGCQVAYTHLSPSTVVLPGSPARSTMTISAASLLYAALAVGFSMIVNAWIFFRISSALFNPAITFGMCVEGKLSWKKALSLVAAQFLAGMAAAGLVTGLFPGRLTAETLLGNGTSVVRGLCEYCFESWSAVYWLTISVVEVFLTAAFVFSVFMLATEKHKGAGAVSRQSSAL